MLLFAEIVSVGQYPEI